MKTLVLSYKRLHEQLRGEYPYEGRITIFTNGDLSVGTEKRRFIKLLFKDIVSHLHEVLLEEPEVSTVLFQRTEREGILPMQLAEDLIQALRVDPVAAFRAMTHNPHPSLGDTATRIYSQETARRVDRFGELLYLDMQNGYVLDPLSGDWRGLAYGEAHGWKINAGDAKPDGWLSIEIIDDAPEGTQFAFRLAFARWASTSVRALLEKKAERYFLPRAWNTDGPWITHEDLERMLTQHQCKEA
jgi:hypothetical protein